MKKHLNNRIPKAILVFLLLTGLITGCEALQAQEKVGLKEKSNSESSEKLSNQGRLRTYYLYTPKSYNPNRPMPLVLVFHGHGGSGRSVAEVTRFNELAEQKGFIVAYPDGIDKNWSVTGDGYSRNVNDVSFVAALIDRLKQSRNIDSRRIYATGFSKGGILAQNLACALPDRIAGFASVAGSLPVPLESSCQSQTPTSMLMINGTKDLSVHYEGDVNSKLDPLISIPETIEFWRKHDECASPAEVKRLPDPNGGDRFQVKTSRYSVCRGGSEVVLTTIKDGGHSWPGGASQDPSQIEYNKNLGFNASAAIWDFFQRHTLPQNIARS